MEKKKVIHYLAQHKDGTYFVVKTDVDIKKDVTVYLDGVEYATTEVFYVIDGEIYVEKTMYEEVCDNCMPPSARYDYTIDIIEGKIDDDYDYAGLNPMKWYKIIERDINAPDNRKTLEDLEVLDVVLPKILPRPTIPGANKNGTLGAKKGNRKNAKHKNQNAREAAKKQYEQYTKKYKETSHMHRKQAEQPSAGKEKEGYPGCRAATALALRGIS